MPAEHFVMLEQITNAIMAAGRGVVSEVASVGIAAEAAENCSECKLTSATGQHYTLSLIIDEED